MKKILLCALLSIVAISQTSAHGVWAGMRSDNLQIVYGEGPLDNTYKPRWLESVSAYDAHFVNAGIIVEEKAGKLFLKPKANVQVIAIVSYNGYWSNTKSSGWVNKAKDENPEATKGKYHRKFSVNYINQKIVFKKDAPTKIAKTQPVGLEMEIVPMVDPRFLQQGDDLQVKVLHNGKPMADTPVMFDAINRLGETVKTNKDGVATVKVMNKGLNMVAVEASFERKDKTKADANGFFTSLNFTLAP